STEISGRGCLRRPVRMKLNGRGSGDTAGIMRMRYAIAWQGPPLKRAGSAWSMKKPELLAPAGDFEKLKTAVHYGADAVYLGDSRFSLRGKAGNFDDAGLRA